MATSLQEYPAGTIIFREGDTSVCAYIIREGQVELTSSGARGAIELATLGPGQLFGEFGLVDGGHRNATAMALTACALLPVSREEFVGSVEGKPGAASSVLKRMGDWLKGTVVPLENPETGRTPQQALPAPDAHPSQSPDAASSPEGDASLPEPAAKGPGFFSRLIGATGDPLGKVDIRVALFEGEGGDILAKKIAQILDKKPGVTSKTLPKALSLDKEADADAALSAVVATGRHWLNGLNADLLIWGEIPDPGLTLHLRFIPRHFGETDRPGMFLYSTDLTLPVEFGDEFSDLLTVVALAATDVEDEQLKQTLDHARAIALQGALKASENMPATVTAKERAGIQLCFANAIATQAYTHQSPDLYHRAAHAYQEALREINRESNPVGWAMAQKSHGTTLQFLAERTGNKETWELAAEAFQQALTVFTRQDHPLQWAECQARLGVVLFRLDAKVTDTDYLKESLVAFQAAVQVFTRHSAPDRWADCLNNFARAAQVLGGQLRSNDALERAVKACRDIVAVRSFEDHPKDWAAAQNNMGSALFLLAKMTRSVEHFSEAAEAFEAAVLAYDKIGDEKLAAIARKNQEKVMAILERRA